MPFRDQLPKWLKDFSATVYFRVIYLILLGFVLLALFPYTFAGSTACLILLLMPITMFVIPYWIGERGARRFIENGLVIFAVAILAISAFQVATVLGSPPVELQSYQDVGLDNTMQLANGTVTPFHSSSPATYVFRVRLTTDSGGPPGNFTVFANLTIIEGLGRAYQDIPMAPESSGDTKNGTFYNTTQSLGASIYGFGFYVRRLGSGNWTATGAILGPIAASGLTYFGFFAYYTVLLLLIPLTFYFLILFMWWYSARARSARQRMAVDLKEPTGRKGTKPRVADKAAKAAAFTCTNCGADVTEDDEKCPKCGAVFED